MFDFLFFFNSILLGVGLAMDAFSVSLANGLNEPTMSRAKSCGIALTFALFQAVMPIIGWVCVHTVVEYFNAFQVAVPYVALALLAFIGGKMIFDGVKKDNEEKTAVGFWAVIVQGVATSIDALSVGFTIATYDLISALVSVGIISLVTFALCIIGVYIGKKFGTALSGKANVLGGIILIAIGLEIFITGII